MAGGITPKAQPMEKIINKMWKGCFCDEYDGFILIDPVNDMIRQPLPPTRKLLAHWIVKAWDKITPN